MSETDELIAALVQASARLQEAYRIARTSGRTDIASRIYASSVRVSTMIGEIATSAPRRAREVAS